MPSLSRVAHIARRDLCVCRITACIVQAEKVAVPGQQRFGLRLGVLSRELMHVGPPFNMRTPLLRAPTSCCSLPLVSAVAVFVVVFCRGFWCECHPQNATARSHREQYYGHLSQQQNMLMVCALPSHTCLKPDIVEGGAQGGGGGFWDGLFADEIAVVGTRKLFPALARGSLSLMKW
jgi:hypothetical protein